MKFIKYLMESATQDEQDTSTNEVRDKIRHIVQSRSYSSAGEKSIFNPVTVIKKLLQDGYSDLILLVGNDHMSDARVTPSEGVRNIKDDYVFIVVRALLSAGYKLYSVKDDFTSEYIDLADEKSIKAHPRNGFELINIGTNTNKIVKYAKEAAKNVNAYIPTIFAAQAVKTNNVKNNVVNIYIMVVDTKVELSAAVDYIDELYTVVKANSHLSEPPAEFIELYAAALTDYTQVPAQSVSQFPVVGQGDSKSAVYIFDDVQNETGRGIKAVKFRVLSKIARLIQLHLGSNKTIISGEVKRGALRMPAKTNVSTKEIADAWRELTKYM